MVQDKLSGVRLVLTIVHVHLELVCLYSRRQTKVCDVSKLTVQFNRKHYYRNTHPCHKAMANIFRQLLIFLQLFQENAGRQ